MVIADAFQIVLDLAKAHADLSEREREAINQVEDFTVNQLGMTDEIPSWPPILSEH